MGWVNFKYKNGKLRLSINPYKTDMGFFKIVKSRQPSSCSLCNKKMPKKTYVFGGSWNKLCLSCGEKFNKDAIGEFENITREIKNNLIYLKKNKSNWNAENVIASL